METRDTPILFFERGLFSFPKKKKKKGFWESGKDFSSTISLLKEFGNLRSSNGKLLTRMGFFDVLVL